MGMLFGGSDEEWEEEYASNLSRENERLEKRVKELEAKDIRSLERNLDALELITKLQRQVRELTGTLNGVVQDVMHNGVEYESRSFVITDDDQNGVDLMQWLDEHRFKNEFFMVAHVDLVFHGEGWK